MEVVLDGGQVPTISLVASKVFKSTQAPSQRVFACDGFSTSNGPTVAVSPGLIDELWVGPPGHRAVLSGALIEWSLDAVGWVVAFLVHASIDAGVRTTILLTVARTDSRL